MISWWVRREEARLNLPPLWVGTTGPDVAIMIRVGPWMLTHEGLFRESRSVSANGRIIKRRWKKLWPK